MADEARLINAKKSESKDIYLNEDGDHAKFIKEKYN